MLDDQLIVEEIKNMLDAEREPLPDEISSLASDYSELCNSANQRLRECSKLLRKGLRSEAIQLCDQEPNLLELVAQLDFPQRPNWCAYLRRAGELPPPDLLMDVAADLNEAYAAEQPLLSLLEKHRKYALARSPLTKRIKVLRQIAHADVGNPVWLEDLRKYEQVRLRQIESEASVAHKAGDIETIRKFEQELNDAGWSERPAEAVVIQVRGWHGKLRVREARKEMERLERELAEAHAQFDVALARTLRGRWLACVNLAEADSYDPLVQMAAPTLEWLEEQDRQEEQQIEFEAGLQRLEQALDQQSTRPELEQLYYAAVRFERGMPELVERRFQERIYSFDHAARRRRLLIVAGVAAAVLLVGALTAVAIRSSMRSKEIADQKAALQQMLDQGQYKEALAHDVGYVADAPELVALKVQAKQINDEQERYREELEKIRAEAVRQAGLDDAEKKPQMQLLIGANDYLRKESSLLVLKLIGAADEQAKIADVERRIKAARDQCQREMDDRFHKELDALGERVEKVDTLEKVGGLKTEIFDLTRRSNLVSKDLLALLDPLKTRLDGLEKTMRMQTKREALLSGVAQNVVKAFEFITALEAYKKEFPDTTRAKDFEQAIREMPLWQKVEAWNVLTAHWSEVKLAKIDAQAAASLVTESKALVDDPVAGSFPSAAAVKDRLAYLETAKSRETALTPLTDVLKNPTIAGLKILQVEQEGGEIKKFYGRTAATEDATTGAIRFKYLIDFNLNEKPLSMVRKEKVRSPLNAAAPQSELASKLQDLLAKRQSLGWEAMFCEMIEQTLANQQIDPILQGLFLKTLMESGAAGSPVLDSACQSPRRNLEEAGVVWTVNWLDPENREATTERTRAKGAIDRMRSDLSKVRATVETKFKALDQAIGPKYELVGWLKRDDKDDTKWICVLSEAARTALVARTTPADLFVVYQPAKDPQATTDPPMSVEKIGRFEQRTTNLSPTTGVWRCEGRPVFAAK
jgi:hypothetical protein